MSKTHTVINGDTLRKISTRYYGSASKWTDIRDSNPQLAVRKTASDGSPLIYPGDILLIPEEIKIPNAVTTATPVVLDDNAEDDISIYINGKLYTGFTGYTLSLPMDGLAAFSFSTVWDDAKKELHDSFRPFTFKQCSVYFSKKIIFTGRLLTSAPSVSPDSKTISIEGYPLCGVLNDCSLPVTKYPPSYSNLNLKQIAEDVVQPFGVKVEFGSSAGDEFEKIEYETGATVLSFLQKLAEQRGLFFTNTEKGWLKFFKPTVEPVLASFREGELPYISCKPNFTSQDFFSHMTGFTKTDKEQDATSYTYEIKYLIKNGVFRPFSFVVDDADSGSLENAVKSKAAQMLFSSCSYELTVVGCTDKFGNLYKKGMSVSLYSPGAMIYRDTKFVVSKLIIKRSDNEGVQTTMSLVLPESLSGSLPEVLPWEE